MKHFDVHDYQNIAAHLFKYYKSIIPVSIHMRILISEVIECLLLNIGFIFSFANNVESQ